MEKDDTLAEYLKDPVAAKFFDLMLGRIFKRVYLSLDEAGKKNVQEVFFSGSDMGKEEFIKIYIPDFDALFSEEVEKLKKELALDFQK